MITELSADSLASLDPSILTELETPCYLFDPSIVAEDLEALRAELGTPVIVSLKASPVLDLLVRCNHVLGDGVEIASMGELNMTIGRISVPRFVNTPAMDGKLVAAALAARATLIVDSPHQITLIESALRTPQAAGRPAPHIILRVNAGSLLGRADASQDQFGMDLPTLYRVLDRLSSGGTKLKVVGLHAFAGSLSFAASAAPLAQALAALVPELRKFSAAPLETVIIGAGLAADWRESLPDFAGYREALAPLKRQVEVRHEAGRAIFSRSGRFAVRVVATKALGERGIVVCDGGMAQCFPLAQTEQFVKRWRSPKLVSLSGEQPADYAEPRTYTVVGNSCNRADVVGQLDTRRAPQPGDMLVFEHCGAYHSYSPTGFLNLRPAQRYIAS